MPSCNIVEVRFKNSRKEFFKIGDVSGLAVGSRSDNVALVAVGSGVGLDVGCGVGDRVGAAVGIGVWVCVCVGAACVAATDGAAEGEPGG
jgi:hypothetical protein